MERRTVRLALAIALTASQPSWSQINAPEDARCLTDVQLLSQVNALPITRARLDHAEPLVVVAIGSSSTQGQGASGPNQTYPAQLAAALRARHRGQSIEVLNRGVGGEIAAQMVARFDRDVFAHHPHLVLWQTGANDVMRKVDLDEFDATLDRGLKLLRAHQLDVILIAPQYATKVADVPNSDQYVARMHQVAARHGVPVFRRYSIMRELAKTQPEMLSELFTADGLHLNDLGYRCLATQLLTAIAGAPMPASDAQRYQ